MICGLPPIELRPSPFVDFAAASRRRTGRPSSGDSEVPALREAPLKEPSRAVARDPDSRNGRNGRMFAGVVVSSSGLQGEARTALFAFVLEGGGQCCARLSQRCEPLCRPLRFSRCLLPAPRCACCCSASASVSVPAALLPLLCLSQFACQPVI